MAAGVLADGNEAREGAGSAAGGSRGSEKGGGSSISENTSNLSRGRMFFGGFEREDGGGERILEVAELKFEDRGCGEGSDG